MKGILLGYIQAQRRCNRDFQAKQRCQREEEIPDNRVSTMNGLAAELHALQRLKSNSKRYSFVSREMHPIKGRPGPV